MRNEQQTNSPVDYEIGDVESFTGTKDNAFSHSALVMIAMKKALEAGCRELRPGWFNSKTDIKGNIIQTYIDDTRRAFIESVRTMQMVLACDLDKTSKKNIKKYKRRLFSKKKELISLNDDSWSSLNTIEKSNYSKNGYRHILGKLTHPTLLEEYTQYELETFRKIFAELSRLTKRLDFFNEEMFEV